jgi:hypothetical protein
MRKTILISVLLLTALPISASAQGGSLLRIFRFGGGAAVEMGSGSQCTNEEIQRMREAGFSEARIAEICRKTRFPIWSRAGEMIFNSAGEYVGNAYPECRYVRYGPSWERCKRIVDLRREENAFRRDEQRPETRTRVFEHPVTCGDYAFYDLTLKRCVCVYGGTYPNCRHNDATGAGNDR